MSDTLYLRRERKINNCGSKHAVIGLNIIKDKAESELCVYGEKSSIRLDFESWNKLLTKKKEVLDFLHERTGHLEADLSSSRFKTFLSGHKGSKNHSMCVRQYNMESEAESFTYMGLVSLEKLFEMETLHRHIFGVFEREMLEINALLREVAARKQSGVHNFTDLGRRTSGGLDMTELLMEIQLQPPVA